MASTSSLTKAEEALYLKEVLAEGTYDMVALDVKYFVYRNQCEGYRCTTCNRIPFGNCLRTICPREHVLCDDCAFRLIQSTEASMTCPSCGADSIELKLAGAMARRVVGALEVNCCHEKQFDGYLGECAEIQCGWQGPFSDLNDHLKQCSFKPLVCKDCMISMPFNAKEAFERHLKSCQMKKTVCPKDCGGL